MCIFSYKLLTQIIVLLYIPMYNIYILYIRTLDSDEFILDIIFLLLRPRQEIITVILNTV